jgi:uncharacterized protein (TIGR02270 family)
MNSSTQRYPRIIPAIVQQHVDDAAFIRSTRTVLVCAPHVRLRKLRDFDDRLAAHLEGLEIAGAAAKPLCDAALEAASRGAVFVSTVRALESRDPTWLQHLLALSESSAQCRRGLVSAFGWTERRQLQGVVSDYLRSRHPFARLVALATCGQHRVDPNLGPAHILEDTDPAVRARAYRTAGELGKREFVSRLANAISEEDPDCQFWAAWSAVLLGDTHGALELLKHIASRPGPWRAPAFQLAFQAMSVGAARALLQSLAHDPSDLRQVIRGAGLIGDPAYIPWLIGLMAQDPLARLAGEAFSLVTGVDSAWLDLERKRPEGFESGASDDPQDSNISLDEDEGLPWPDHVKVQEWWQANAQRFQAGIRYFMGAPVNRDACLRVLHEGFQRQRIAAALYLSLLNPGTPLFEWRAPARRQQRLLAEMT